MVFEHKRGVGADMQASG